MEVSRDCVPGVKRSKRPSAGKKSQKMPSIVLRSLGIRQMLEDRISYVLVARIQILDASTSAVIASMLHVRVVI
jgi:hypothetical protein